STIYTGPAVHSATGRGRRTPPGGATLWGMWKRVHLAALDGPDPGHTIELGAAGRGLTPVPPVIVGRSAFADVQSADPSLSRAHCSAHAGISRWGQIGAWIQETDQGNSPARPGEHVRVGQRLRRGATTFEVRTDAPPRPIRLGGI